MYTQTQNVSPVSCFSRPTELTGGWWQAILNRDSKNKRITYCWVERVNAVWFGLVQVVNLESLVNIWIVLNQRVCAGDSMNILWLQELSKSVRGWQSSRISRPFEACLESKMIYDLFEKCCVVVVLWTIRLQLHVPQSNQVFAATMHHCVWRDLDLSCFNYLQVCIYITPPVDVALAACYRICLLRGFPPLRISWRTDFI